MSKSVSFRDLLKVPALKNFREIELIAPHLDNVMKEWLYALGIDTRQPVQYVANLHRDMNNVAAIGYRAIGEIREDRGYTRSNLCDQIERIIVAGKKDPSLSKELAEMMNRTVNFKAFSEDGEDEPDNDSFPAEMIEPDYKDNLSIINTLNDLVLQARGDSWVKFD